MNKFILKKLYDIRPKKGGELDYEWIKYGKQERRKKQQYQRIEVNLKEVKPNWEKEEKKTETKKDKKRASIFKLKKPIPKKSFFSKVESPNFSFAWIKQPPFSLSRSFVSFLVGLLVVAAIIPGFSYVRKNISWQSLASEENLLSSGTQAYESLLRAKESLENLNPTSARANFESALNNLEKANKEIGPGKKAALQVASLLPGENILSSGQNLLEAGTNIAKSGIYMTRSLEILQEADFGRVIQTTDQRPEENPIKIGAILESAEKNLNLAYEEAQKAQTKIQKIDPADFPENYRPKLTQLQSSLPFLMDTFDKQREYFTLASELLGRNSYKKYLILFQNNTEIRPTGGFIGSFAEVTIDQGQITNLKIDGIYSIDGQLNTKVEPPTPIKKISSAWSTHDSNWFFDFPTSAQKASFFYEKTGQSSVDGVITITPEVLKRILKLTGPIEIKKYGMTVTHKNFLDNLQQHVEEDYDKMLNRPKKILADLTPKIVAKLSSLEKESLIQLLTDLNQGLNQKEILLYSEDEKLQEFIETRGWGGNIYSGTDDYLAVVNANINGYKTDRYIDQKINLEAEIQEQGKIKHTLSITRTHKGGDKDQSWYNKVNANYMRVFVPRNTILAQAQGFTKEKVEDPIDYEELNFQQDPQMQKIKQNQVYDSKTGTYISNQHGKKVIGGWVYTSPGETTEVTLTYITEKKDLGGNLNFLFQKQPGQLNNSFQADFKLPPSKEIKSFSPGKLEIQNASAQIKDNLEKDLLVNFQLE